jgi:hypothetical protein
MITIARFHKNEEAHLFRSFLGSEGIEAHILNEVVSQLLPHHCFATGGTRLAVAEENAERAEALYREYQDRVLEGPPVVGDARAWPFALLISLLLGGPLLWFGRKAVRGDNGKP